MLFLLYVTDKKSRKIYFETFLKFWCTELRIFKIGKAVGDRAVYHALELKTHKTILLRYLLQDKVIKIDEIFIVDLTCTYYIMSNRR